MKKIRLVTTAFFLIAISQLAACQNLSNEKNNKVNNKKTKEMKTIQLTQTDFLTKVMDYQNNPQEWKYLGDKPALIDFYADWCGPCKMIAPVLEELAAEYDDKVYIYKINTEKEEELAALFGIRSIPSLFLFLWAKRLRWHKEPYLKMS